jgi:hypothetical protein
MGWQAPKELIEELEVDIRNGKLMRERRVKHYLIGFREYLGSSNLAPLTEEKNGWRFKFFHFLQYWTS